MSKRQNYDEIRAELAEFTMAQWAQFAMAKGLRLPSEISLKQMSVDYKTVTDEVVMFGMDVWPCGIGNDDEGGSGGNAPGPIGPRPGLFSTIARQLAPVLMACSLLLCMATAPRVGETIVSMSSASMALFDLLDDGIVNMSVSIPA